MTTRIFIDQPLEKGQTLTLTGDHAHYLMHVLRCEPGDQLLLIDSRSIEHTVVIRKCSDTGVRVEPVASRRPSEQQFHLTLYQALLKRKNFELVVQKCTELGAAQIVPIITERTVSRPKPDRIPSRLQRWRKIAREACRQCGRTKTPQIPEPLSCEEAIQRWQGSGTPGLIPYEALAGTESIQLHQRLSELPADGSLSVFIGPEGGFSPAEMQTARHADLQPVSLGKRILRAETAAIAICAIVMYHAEHVNPREP